MARETCNLNKEEAEILKPSPSSNPSPSPASPPVTSSPPSLFSKARPEAKIAATAVISEAKTEEEDEPEQPVRFGNRCSTCQKRVGLTGFRCRCGDLFCGRHRYSDCHDCSFDYKAAGREEILKNNPVVRAAKIIKI